MRFSQIAGMYVEENVGFALPPAIISSPTNIVAFFGDIPGRDVPILLLSASDWNLETASGVSKPLRTLVDDAFANGLLSAILVPCESPDALPQAIEKLEAMPSVHPQLVCVSCQTPILESESLFSELHAYCRRTRALLLLDPPESWNSVASAIAGVQLLGTHPNAAVFYPPAIRYDQSTTLSPVTGAIAGLIARTDTARGVWKAPAGTAATLVGLDSLAVALPDEARAALNSAGINTLRQFRDADGSNRVILFGARLLGATDGMSPELRYLPTRRLTLFIESSIDAGIEWATFEPNTELLWAMIRFTVADFLHKLWLEGALVGQTPRDSYFVQCDRTTMTSEDIALGNLRVVVGFAPLRPAEFVVRAFMQSTADSA